ncbi:MAG: hypothetical protein LBG87_06170 [Spirochaetaceae bacterium]|jgi:hypothetical protein|nr:hypothetical protein [Spirochaetaceae bacterium]
METLADLRRQGIQPDPKWAEKHGAAASAEKPRGYFDSAGMYHPSPEDAPWVPREEYARNKEKYGYSITDAQAKGIDDLIAETEERVKQLRIEAQAKGLEDFISLFPESDQRELRYRAAASLKLSESLGIPLEKVYENLDLYRQEMYPHIQSTETFLQTLDRGWKTGKLSKQIGKVTGDFLKLSPAEQAAGFAEYKQKIGALNLEISRNADAIPVNGIAKSAGDTVQSLALIGGGMVLSGLASFGAGVLTANPLIGAGVGSAVNFALNAPVYTNLAYADMVMAGIDEKNGIPAKKSGIL